MGWGRQSPSVTIGTFKQKYEFACEIDAKIAYIGL